MKKNAIMLLMVLLLSSILSVVAADTTFTVTLPAGYTYAHFNLSGIAGGVAHDSSGNGNDGTVYNATWVGDGLYFNGRDAYVKVPHSDTLNIAEGNKITITMWACLTGWEKGYPRGVVIDKRTNKEANYNWEFDDSVMQMRIHTSGTYYAVDFPHSLNTWNYYAMVLDGDTLKGYLNGELKDTVTGVSTSGTNTEDLHIGEAIWENYRTKGFISSVRIYNRALSEEEIQDIYYNNSIPRDGLVGEWTFDHGPSTQLNVTPLGQNSTTPFYNITNTGDVNLTIRMNLNATVPDVILKADTDNNPMGAKEINTTYATLYEDLAPGSSVNIWLWTDLFHAAEQQTNRTLEINVTQT
nr:LamG domain-containing protein [Candidatus Sigynarchaeota archaeon]